MKIQVVLADGRKLFREGLSALLNKHPDIVIAGEADEVAAGARLARAVSAHVVILNASLSARAIAENVRLLLNVKPSLRVIVLLMHRDDPAIVREVLRAGAAGCLTRECATEELVRAIHAVSQKQTYLSPALTHAVVSGYVLESEGASTVRPITPREREILRRIADGQTTKQIALHLRVGVKTVETHRRRLMEKLGCHSIAELTKYAIREGLTSLEVSG